MALFILYSAKKNKIEIKKNDIDFGRLRFDDKEAGYWVNHPFLIFNRTLSKKNLVTKRKDLKKSEIYNEKFKRKRFTK